MALELAKPELPLAPAGVSTKAGAGVRAGEGAFDHGSMSAAEGMGGKLVEEEGTRGS